MHIHWWRVFFLEALIIFGIMCALGYVKKPKFLRKKVLVPGFPWGYYTDKVPQADSGFFSDNSNDFMHDVGTEFGGLEGFGDFGEFSGFGEMGEFGANFSYSPGSGGGGE